MPAATSPKSPWPDLELATDDGRKQRSGRSRRQIIEALFDLLREGDMSPSAASVAERANVGLRTVFRHFEDMDSIYNEMTRQLMAIIAPKIEQPFEAPTWQGQLAEMIERRADIYETVSPMRVCMMMRYYQSAFIREQYQRDQQLERRSLKSILPKHIVTNETVFAALEVALGFPTWRQLRQDQKLSVTRTKQTVQHMADSLIAGLDAR